MMKTNTITITNAYLVEREEDQGFEGVDLDFDLYNQVTQGITIMNPDFIASSIYEAIDPKKCLTKQHSIMVFDGQSKT
mgnify:CR=1 FL=1